MYVIYTAGPVGKCLDLIVVFGIRNGTAMSNLFSMGGQCIFESITQMGF